MPPVPSTCNISTVSSIGRELACAPDAECLIRPNERHLMTHHDLQGCGDGGTCDVECQPWLRLCLRHALEHHQTRDLI
jgi:hypothetical protein